MAYAVLHIQKGKSGSSRGLSAHIERSGYVHRADPKKTKDNFVIEQRGGILEVIKHKDFEKEGVQSLEKKLKYTINEYKDKIKTEKKGMLRANSVTHLNIILTSGHDKMEELKQKGKLEEWAKENYRFAAKTFGEKNIVNFAVHCDEFTPHIHCTVTPFTKDGRLCAKEIMSPKNLKSYQDTYAKAMQPFGMERGIEGSKRKHEDTKVYEQKRSLSKILPSGLPKIEKPSRFGNLDKWAEEANKKITQVAELASTKLTHAKSRIAEVENKIKEIEREKSELIASVVKEDPKASIPEKYIFKMRETTPVETPKGCEDIFPKFVTILPIVAKEKPSEARLSTIGLQPLIRLDIANVSTANSIITKAEQLGVKTNRGIILIHPQILAKTKFLPDELEGVKVSVKYKFVADLKAEKLPQAVLLQIEKMIREEGGKKVCDNTFAFDTFANVQKVHESLTIGKVEEMKKELEQKTTLDETQKVATGVAMADIEHVQEPEPMPRKSKGLKL